MRGFALILVLVALTFLVAVGLPFAIATGYQRVLAENALRQKRAYLAALGALNHAIASLRKTNTDAEHSALLATSQSSDGSEQALLTQSHNSTPDYDSEDEFLVEPLTPQSLGEGNDDLLQSRVVMWARAQDENAFVNVNSASPWLIANLLGVARLKKKISYNTTKIELDDASFLFSDGDPETVDGFVRVGREYIAYRHIEGNTLTGCIRGLFLNPRTHEAGELVWDGRAFKIAAHRTEAVKGALTLFETPQAIRQVALWCRFDTIAEVLKYRRLFFEQLKEYGVTPEDLENAGIDPNALKTPQDWEKPTIPDNVDSLLRKYGVDPKAIEEGMEPRELLLLSRYAQRLSRMLGGGDQNRRQRRFNRRLQDLLDSLGLDAEGFFKKFLEEVEDYYSKRGKFLKRYFPQALRDLASLRRLADLETIDALTYKRFEPYITTFSLRDDDWSEPGLLVSDVPLEQEEGFWTRRVIRISGSCSRYINRGTVLRIYTENGEEFATVSGRWGSTIYLERELRGTYTAGEAWVQAMLRHPVNINACDDRVLKALLVGLTFRTYESLPEVAKIFWKLTGREIEQDYVTPEEADAVIARIRANPPHNHQQLRDILQAAAEAGEISQQDALAIITNAINANDPNLAVSTAPFCYASKDAFRINAYGVVLGGEGQELARCHIRASVITSPTKKLSWMLDSQRDLSDGVVRYANRTTGYRSVIAFPGRLMHMLYSGPRDLLPQRNEPAVFPDTTHDPQQAHLRLWSSRDGSGFLFVQHFDTTYDGEDISPLPFDVRRQFPTQKAGVRRAVTMMAPGLFACWIKLQNPAGGFYLFDTGGLGEKEDRICCFYDGKQLVLRVADATMEEKAAEIRADFVFEPNRWYHIAAMWRGCCFGDLQLWVDGTPVGSQTNYARLAVDIDEKTISIPVDDAQALNLERPDPQNGIRPAIKVGDEVMEVEQISGNTLVVRWVVQGKQKVRAACRGTRPTRHLRGTIVEPLGYSVRLGEAVRVGGATLLDPIPQNTPITTVRPWKKGEKRLDTIIPVISTDGFPTQGVIQVGGERVLYGSKTQDAFTNCTRGVDGTSQAPVMPGIPVVLAGFRVTDTSDYKKRGYVQIDDEWIKYRLSDDERLKGYMLFDRGGSSGGSRTPPRGPQPVPVQPRPVPVRPRPVPPGGQQRPWQPKPIRPIPHPGGDSSHFVFLQSAPTDAARGTCDTQPQEHAVGAKVIPVFSVRGRLCGGGDLVTILDNSESSPRKALMRINHTHNNLVAFTDFVPRRFETSPWGRLLKFPSGELPTYLAPQGLLAASALATTRTSPAGKFDEIVITRVNPLSITVDTNSGASLTLNTPRWRGRTVCGLVRVDEEVVFLKSDGSVIRGLFGSVPTEAPRGTKALFLPFPYPYEFNGAISADSFALSVVPSRSFGRVPYQPGGRGVAFLACYDAGGRFLGVLPTRAARYRYADNYGAPCFDSAFGTQHLTGATPAFALAIPYRYIDLYGERTWSSQGVYFEARRVIPRARFLSVHWDADTPPGTRVIVAVRVDGTPSWDAEPAKPDEKDKRGKLLLFSNPEGENFIGVTGSKIEVRVYLTYIPGAYEQGLWKETPTLRSITIEYESQTQVRWLEVLSR